MIELFSEHQVNRSGWEDIVDQGYPEDDALFDLMELCMDWKSGKSIDPNFFLSRWESELSPLPDTVFQILESMSWSNNNGKLLKSLASLDKGNICLSESDLNLLLSRSNFVASRNGKDLLDYVKTVRGKPIEKKCKIIERNFGPKHFFSPALKFTKNGWSKKFQIYPQKRLKAVHYRIAFRVAGAQNTTNNNPSVSIRVDHYNRDNKNVGAKIGNIYFVRDPYGSFVNTSGGGLGHAGRYSVADKFPLQVEGQPIPDVKKSPLVTMDIVIVNNECAIFCNGRSYAHWPVGAIEKDWLFLSGWVDLQ